MEEAAYPPTATTHTVSPVSVNGSYDQKYYAESLLAISYPPPYNIITSAHAIKASNPPLKVERTVLLTPPISSTSDASTLDATVMPQESPSQRSLSNGAQGTPHPMNEINAQPAAKPKRVRTGCLTCRERHLKCDEALPICQNCNKSNRKCKRGVRLNFIDITCQRPPYLLPPTHDWKVTFQDDSRDIASEYRGGFERYSPLAQSPKRRKLSSPEQVEYQYNHVSAPVMSHQQIPQQVYQSYAEPQNTMYASTSAPSFEDSIAHQMSYDQGRPSYDPPMMVQQPEEIPPYLTDRDETFYLQVFVEEVGNWMDSMDPDKHFSRLLPFQALRQPMLKHALLACGVRHLTLINPAYADEHAVKYYNMATQALLTTLQNPDRDTVLCATTATVLNVYEVMSEKALQRMNHIAGARALIKECRWDANASGIGAACFWLNVGLEMFSCLHFNWGVAWDPDTWGIDMNMSPQPIGGNEEEWTHKILWILAKITNFRSSVPRFKEQTPHAEQMRSATRNQLWMNLRSFCEKWDGCVPPTMHAVACLPPYLSSSKSSFPELWYIKRATVVARLFYHTALALLGSVHPLAESNPQINEEMHQLKTYHAKQICGIVAHVKDRLVLI